MAAIAEWLVLRKAAAAQGSAGSAPLSVETLNRDRHVAGDSQGTILGQGHRQRAGVVFKWLAGISQCNVLVKICLLVAAVAIGLHPHRCHQ